MEAFKVTNETIAIIGVIAVAIVSMFTIPESKDVVLALGGGVVGYLTGKSE